MDLHRLLYQSALNCPVCSQSFDAVKVKASALRKESIDTDFFTRYQEIHPIFYEIVVCPSCGYAEFQERLDKISNAEKELVKKGVSPNWVKKNLNIERDAATAIETYEIFLKNLKAKLAPNSVFARATLRIAWIYRILKDDREIETLAHAAKYYLDAYQEEDFPIGKLDEATCLYIIGELYRRAGHEENALKWLGQTLVLPPERKNSKISDMARDQIEEARQALKKKQQIEKELAEKEATVSL